MACGVNWRQRGNTQKFFSLIRIGEIAQEIPKFPEESLSKHEVKEVVEEDAKEWRGEGAAPGDNAIRSNYKEVRQLLGQVWIIEFEYYLVYFVPRTSAKSSLTTKLSNKQDNVGLEKCRGGRSQPLETTNTRTSWSMSRSNLSITYLALLFKSLCIQKIFVRYVCR